MLTGPHRWVFPGLRSVYNASVICPSRKEDLGEATPNHNRRGMRRRGCGPRSELRR